MSELRWTLLILGVVFIAALSWWERRRPRQAFAPRLRETSLGPGSEPRSGEHPDTLSFPEIHGRGGDGDGLAHGAAHSREPWIGDADISDAVISDVALTDAADAHERASDEAAHAHLGPSVPAPLEELPTLIIPPDAEERLALQAAWDAAPAEPTLVDPDASVTLDPPAEKAAERTPSARKNAPASVPPSGSVPVSASAEEIPGAEGVGAVRVVEPAASGGDGAGSPEPIVEWPPEESRRILALRLIAPHAERFPGRTLRLALAAEGFLLGKFSIFHKPDESNRAVLSAASLTRPGAFDLETMDVQRYGGLSLFAVLPGPKSPAQAFEELLATARNLNERLQGALQDERGGPLTTMRVASIRESLRADAANPPAAAANET